MTPQPGTRVRKGCHKFENYKPVNLYNSKQLSLAVSELLKAISNRCLQGYMVPIYGGSRELFSMGCLQGFVVL